MKYLYGAVAIIAIVVGAIFVNKGIDKLERKQSDDRKMIAEKNAPVVSTEKDCDTYYERSRKLGALAEYYGSYHYADRSIAAGLLYQNCQARFELEKKRENEERISKKCGSLLEKAVLYMKEAEGKDFPGLAAMSANQSAGYSLLYENCRRIESLK